MNKPDWKRAPEDATHFHPSAMFAIWYKKIDGVWHYFGTLRKWNKTIDSGIMEDHLEARPSC